MRPVAPWPPRRIVRAGGCAMFVEVDHIGIVAGTWAEARGQLSVDSFSEAGSPPTSLIKAEAARLARILDRPLELSIRTAAP